MHGKQQEIDDDREMYLILNEEELPANADEEKVDFLQFGVEDQNLR